MASLRRLPNSPYWIACFRLPDGRRTQRSTGTTDKKEAQRVANKYEDASEDARSGRFNESRARRVISDIFQMANRDALPCSSTGAFFDAWLKRKELEAGPKTYQRYAAVINQFRDFLGQKIARDITQLSSRDVTAFRDSLAKRVTAGTVNLSVKIIRAALAQARRDGLVDHNEGEKVTLIERGRSFERRPFTLPELQRILEVASDEWRGMIMVGLYTGQRLGDVASLTWSNVDLQRQEIRLTTAKTNRRQVIPIAAPLLKFLEGLPAGDDPTAPLFPDACATRQRNEHSGTLSNQFYNILVAAGLAQKKTHKSTGKGRSAKREQNELSFHALRHTATSLLKNAGVSDAVAREFVGHDSAEVSRRYTHIDTETLRKAANTLPNLLQTAA